MASILAAEFHRSAQTIGDGRFLFTCLVSTMILLLVFKQSAEATETTSPAATLSDAQCPAPNINIQIASRDDRLVATSGLHPRDCSEVQSAGHTQSGRYTVYPDDGDDPFSVYCDMDTSGGGWTVFQRRENGLVDFYRSWSEYEMGFGHVVGEHWLGNEKIHRLTTQKRYTLRVDLWDWQQGTAFAEYDLFLLLGQETQYQLVLGQYHGTAGDALNNGSHLGKSFTTFDADHDSRSSENCASLYHGAWWYANCHNANLNGRYVARDAANTASPSGIVWMDWKGTFLPLKAAVMKLRPN